MQVSLSLFYIKMHFYTVNSKMHITLDWIVTLWYPSIHIHYIIRNNKKSHAWISIDSLTIQQNLGLLHEYQWESIHVACVYT